MGERNIDSLLQEEIYPIYGQNIHILSTVRLSFLETTEMKPPIWGLLFIQVDPGPNIVFYHFYNPGLLDNLSSRKEKAEDLALVFPIEGLKLEYVEKPGFLKRLLKSDVGKVQISSLSMIESEYKSNSCISTRELTTAVQIELDLESVSDFTSAISPYLTA